MTNLAVIQELYRAINLTRLAQSTFDFLEMVDEHQLIIDAFDARRR